MRSSVVRILTLPRLLPTGVTLSVEGEIDALWDIGTWLSSSNALRIDATATASKKYKCSVQIEFTFNGATQLGNKPILIYFL